jgi:hypothetical protein
MASATRANAINNSDLKTRMMDMLTPSISLPAS